MRHQFASILAWAVLLAAADSIAPAFADDLVRQVQADLTALGYKPGNIDGEATTPTAVAIAKFQAENGLEVTGETSLMLADILSAKVSQEDAPPAPPALPAPQARDPEELRAAQQACLEKRAASAQAAQKKKSGIGSLLSAVGRTATRFGNYGISRATEDAYLAGATAGDLSAAAKDLGLTEDDAEACRNPP